MRRALFAGLAAIAATVLALELLLRLLPVSTATLLGYHFDRDVLTHPAHLAWTVSTGWDLRNPQRAVSNNRGFVADRDFQRDSDAVALIGDSYVEAAMLPAPDRPGARLEALLRPRRPVYAMGSPGTALLDHGERVRLASQQFGTTDFVLLLEAGDARQALCGSGNVHSRCLDPRTLAPRTERIADPSRFKRIARHSAFVQYFYSQLKLDPARLLATAFQPPGNGAESAAGHAPASPASAAVPAAERQWSRAVVGAVVDHFFADIAPYPRRRLVVLVDGRRDGSTDTSALGLERRDLIERLRAHGAEVIDLEPVYAAHAARSPLTLRVGPYDNHLNAIGVRLAMAAAANALQSPAGQR